MKQSRSRSRNGGIIPLVAVLLPVTVAIAAFAINLAYFELNRTEMYIAADVVARAAGREFALTGKEAAAIDAGQRAAAQNTVAGKIVEVDAKNFVFGEASRKDAKSRYEFSKGGSNPNAVEVTIQRSEKSSGGSLTALLPVASFGEAFATSRSSRANQVEADISLIIDRSGSMAYAADEKAVYPPFPKSASKSWNFGQEAPNPSRWRDAVKSVDVFLEELNKTPMKEMVALTTYASDAGIDQVLTEDYGNISKALDKYTQTFNSGATNIAGGLTNGSVVLSGVGARAFSSKVIVLLTDGIDTTKSDVLKAAKDAADKKIMIFTVTFSDEADKVTMQKIAETGMGKHFHAIDAKDLEDIFRAIAREIPVLITK